MVPLVASPVPAGTAASVDPVTALRPDDLTEDPLDCVPMSAKIPQDD